MPALNFCPWNKNIPGYYFIPDGCKLSEAKIREMQATIDEWNSRLYGLTQLSVTKLRKELSTIKNPNVLTDLFLIFWEEQAANTKLWAVRYRIAELIGFEYG